MSHQTRKGVRVGIEKCGGKGNNKGLQKSQCPRKAKHSLVPEGRLVYYVVRIESVGGFTTCQKKKIEFGEDDQARKTVPESLILRCLYSEC